MELGNNTLIYGYLFMWLVTAGALYKGDIVIAALTALLWPVVIPTRFLRRWVI